MRGGKGGKRNLHLYQGRKRKNRKGACLYYALISGKGRGKGKKKGGIESSFLLHRGEKEGS